MIKLMLPKYVDINKRPLVLVGGFSGLTEGPETPETWLNAPAAGES